MGKFSRRGLSIKNNNRKRWKKRKKTDLITISARKIVVNVQFSVRLDSCVQGEWFKIEEWREARKKDRWRERAMEGMEEETDVMTGGKGVLGKGRNKQMLT